MSQSRFLDVWNESVNTSYPRSSFDTPVGLKRLGKRMQRFRGPPAGVPTKKVYPVMAPFAFLGLTSRETEKKDIS